MGRKKKIPDGMTKRGDVYYASFRKKGKRVRKRLSTNLEAATEILNKLRADADRGDFGLISIDFPWADLKTKFLKWAKRNVRNHEQYGRDLEKFEAFRPIRSVREVTAERIDDYREHRLSVVCPRTVNHEVGTVVNMLNKGAKRFKVISYNPIAEIVPLAHLEKKKERRSLTTEEVLAIFEHSPEHLKPVWRMYMTTGIRKSELVEMTFDWIDFDAKCVVIPAAHAKGKKDREIPLDDAMLSTIRQLRDRSPHRQPAEGNAARITRGQLKNFSRDHVFVTSVNTPWRNNLLTRFYTICKAAGIEGAEPWGSVDIHALRGSFITLAIDGGANPKAVQTIVGHSTLAMTMNTYAKATDRGKRQAIGALEFATCSEPSHVLKLDGLDTDWPQASEKVDGGLQSVNAIA